ncbi:hypothetical protein OPV22_015880 [Ensete ventricosum]|uniref:Uncharacterized protein n=1 Tax=Ensete ventricosum TaxID=4639 RepID=A0AAV8R6M0_ENSVE|nr:hypothetical protein OPV22_015880 [Ensete ventricosum]
MRIGCDRDAHAPLPLPPPLCGGEASERERERERETAEGACQRKAVSRVKFSTVALHISQQRSHRCRRQFCPRRTEEVAKSLIFFRMFIVATQLGFVLDLKLFRVTNG